MKRNFSTIQFKLMSLGGGIGIILAIFIMLFLPSKIRLLTNDIMKKSAGSAFIVKLLSNNLALGVNAMILDGGKSIDQTLEMLDIGKPGSLITSVSIFDSDLKLIKGDTQDLQQINNYGKTDTTRVMDGKKELRIYTPLRDETNDLVGFMEITFTKSHLNSEIDRFIRVLLIASLVMIGGCFAVAFFVSRKIISVLQRVAGKIKTTADYVASVSSRIAISSHTMASRASKQAASVEETSQTTTEISLMTKRTVDNAKNAKDLVIETNEVVNQVKTAMDELRQSFEATCKASEETFRIVKSIDELAFQTNLLSLNAAVEAARAGEAGAGFSIVAEEVRNLATKSAEAANSTSSLIEQTVQRIKSSENLVLDANAIFQKVFVMTRKIETFIMEIVSASEEQARWIEQVNQNVAEVDQTARANATDADRFSATSQQLNQHANHMDGVIWELMDLVASHNKANKITQYLPNSADSASRHMRPLQNDENIKLH